MKNAGFKDIRTNRFIWRNLLKSPTDACDFFSAVTSSWWYALMPEAKRGYEYLKVQQYFKKKDIKQVTDDITVGYGLK